MSFRNCGGNRHNQILNYSSIFVPVIVIELPKSSASLAIQILSIPSNPASCWHIISKIFRQIWPMMAQIPNFPGLIRFLSTHPSIIIFRSGQNLNDIRGESFRNSCKELFSNFLIMLIFKGSRFQHHPPPSPPETRGNFLVDWAECCLETKSWRL